MKIIILYDNTSSQHNLTADWGFSCLVEAYGRNILFDTGASGPILLDNMKKLNIAPSIFDEIFISHDHWDHVGGLSSFLDINSDVDLIVPFSFSDYQYHGKTIRVDQPVKLHEYIYSTGELDDIEQSLVIETNKGLVIVVGCSHPRMEEILSTASLFGKPYAIVGGLHGFREYELFEGLELICPAHCTQHKTEIKSRYPEKCIEGGAGKVIEI